MPRAALLALLVAGFLAGWLSAQQRAGVPFRGNAGGRPLTSGSVHRHQNGFGGVFVPYDEPLGYGQPGVADASEGPAPPALILRVPETPLPEAKVIEVAGAADATVARVLPPSVFVLANGERLETRRFVLTASNLSFSVGRQQRSIPLSLLDIDATLIANRARGIDLRIPADRTEISLSF